MAYKVDYYKLSIMNDGHIGNINQGVGHIFTDSDIENIPQLLNDYLKPKKYVGIITKIESVGGVCL
jgi:hypothetical protein